MTTEQPRDVSRRNIPVAQRAILEDRWYMATTDVTRFEGEASLSSVNGERWERVNRSLEELAARLVDEVPDDEYDGTDGLVQLTESIWQDIRSKTIEWAIRVEARRQTHRLEAVQ